MNGCRRQMDETLAGRQHDGMANRIGYRQRRRKRLLRTTVKIASNVFGLILGALLALIIALAVLR